jgi:hypothetical protein
MDDRKLFLEGLRLLEKETRVNYKKAKLNINYDPIRDISELRQSWDNMTPRQRATNINRMADEEAVIKNRIAKQVGNSFDTIFNKEISLRIKLDDIIALIKSLEYSLDC